MGLDQDITCTYVPDVHLDIHLALSKIGTKTVPEPAACLPNRLSGHLSQPGHWPCSPKIIPLGEWGCSFFKIVNFPEKNYLTILPISPFHYQ